MNMMNTASLVIIPIEELNQLKQLRSTGPNVPTSKHVTAKEFMSAQRSVEPSLINWSCAFDLKVQEYLAMEHVNRKT